MDAFMKTYSMFYPALRRLLRLGIAVLCYCHRGISITEAFEVSNRFLGEFDKE